MKKIRTIIALTLIAALLAVSFSTQFFAATIYESNGFYYTLQSATTCELYGRSSEDVDLVIPKDLSDYYVASIKDSAFYNDDKIESLDLNKAALLQSIGYYAFDSCANLSGTVFFGGRINRIGVSAFQNCTSLEGARITATGVRTIYAQTFYNCYSLSNVVLPGYLERIEKLAFANTALTEITIPKSVTFIDNSAFDGCEGLVIYCYTDSAAHLFAEENGYEYVLLDAPEPTEPPTEPEPTEAEQPTELEPTEAETTEPTTVEPTVSGYFIGDANGDGSITTVDATLIQRFLCNISVDVEPDILIHGDVDQNGFLSIIDVTCIMRHLANIEAPYEVGKFITM